MTSCRRALTVRTSAARHCLAMYTRPELRPWPGGSSPASAAPRARGRGRRGSRGRGPSRPVSQTQVRQTAPRFAYEALLRVSFCAASSSRKERKRKLKPGIQVEQHPQAAGTGHVESRSAASSPDTVVAIRGSAPPARIATTSAPEKRPKMPGAGAVATAPPAPLSPASARPPIQQQPPAVSLTSGILSRLLESQKHADAAWSSGEIEFLRTLILKNGTGDWEVKAAQLNHKHHGSWKIRSATSLESMAASLQAMQKSGPMLPAEQSLQTAADAEKKKAESSQEETCTLCGSSESGDEKHLMRCGGCSTLQHNACLVSRFPPPPFRPCDISLFLRRLLLWHWPTSRWATGTAGFARRTACGVCSSTKHIR